MVRSPVHAHTPCPVLEKMGDAVPPVVAGLTGGRDTMSVPSAP
jgi:hypothetical protein